MARHYVLLDACVLAAYYAPKSTHNSVLVARAEQLLAGLSPDADVRFLIPNFCIPEVFAVFEKYRWGKAWNKHVKGKRFLTPAEFKRARNAFGEAIHNGSKILQIELDRYHVLCVDLISPINNAYKINRVRGGAAAKTRAKSTSPASTYDMLVVAMSIWLSHQHGADNFTLVTADQRISDVVFRARSIMLSKPIRDHLKDSASRIGLTYSSSLYPCVINLPKATKTELRTRFNNWGPTW